MRTQSSAEEPVLVQEQSSTTSSSSTTSTNQGYKEVGIGEQYAGTTSPVPPPIDHGGGTQASIEQGGPQAS